MCHCACFYVGVEDSHLRLYVCAATVLATKPSLQPPKLSFKGGDIFNYVYLYMSECPHKGQRCHTPLEVELQASMNCHVRVGNLGPVEEQ